MKTNLATGLVGIALLFGPVPFAADKDKKPQNDDMRKAIEFQHQKDLADARQERLESKHPSVTYGNADRRMEDAKPENTVKDPGEAAWQRDKKKK